MQKQTLLLLVLLSTAGATAAGADSPLEFWFSTSNLQPVGPESPQLELAAGSTRDLFLWCRPATGVNLRNFALNVVAQSGLDLVDGSFEVFNVSKPGVNRFEYITDSASNPPLVSEFSEADVLAGDADSLLNLQGFTIFPSPNIAGIGPICGTGEIGCALALDGMPAWLLGSLSLKAITAGTQVDLHLQVGDFGMNQVSYPAGDYNFSGLVDRADYDLWRASFGSNLSLAADGNRNGTVDAADYAIWRNHFGLTSTLQPTTEVPVKFGFDSTPQTPSIYNAFMDRGITLMGDEPDAVIHISGPGAGSGAVLVPEPTTFLILIFVLITAGCGQSYWR